MNYTITLGDGQELTNLELNGSCFISANPIDESIFEDNLAPVVITAYDADVLVSEETHEQMAFIRSWQDQGKYWFALCDVSEAEMEYARNRADIQYLAMMADIEL